MVKHANIRRWLPVALLITIAVSTLLLMYLRAQAADRLTIRLYRAQLGQPGVANITCSFQHEDGAVLAATTDQAGYMQPALAAGNWSVDCGFLRQSLVVGEVRGQVLIEWAVYSVYLATVQREENEEE